MIVSELPQQTVANWTQTAFDDFYTAHAAGVYRYIYFRTGMDRAIAAELTGDVFLALWKARRPAAETALGYLFSIARRKVVDYYRAHGRAREISFSELAADEQRWLNGLVADDAEMAPATSCPHLGAAREVVGQALTALESEFQQLLVDKYVHGHSIKLLAERAEKTESAITSQLARARAKLRELLARRMKNEARQ